MATAAVPRTTSEITTRGHRSEHLFFCGMALLLLATVFVGFAHTYFLAGIFRAPLPSRIIHVHAVLFSTWIFLLITQTSLVSAGRVHIHRRLGIAGFGLACLMVIVGTLAGNDLLARGGSPPGVDPKTFYAVPLGHMLLFAILIFAAFRARFNPSAHKRLILIATIVLTDAATARWPVSLITGRPYLGGIFQYAFVLLIVLYDLWRTRSVHRTTVWAGAIAVIVPNLLVPIGSTATWHTFADWVLRLTH